MDDMNLTFSRSSEKKLNMGSHVFKHENISHRRRNSSPQFSYVNGGELHTQNDATSMGSKKSKPKVITMELQ